MNHPRTTELVQFIDAHRAALRATVNAVPVVHRDRRPAPNRWSVAECLEHVAIVETVVAGRLAAGFEAARDQLGPETEAGAIIDDTFVSRIMDRSSRFKTGAPSVPTGTLDAEAAWRALEASRRTFRDLLDCADGLDVRAIEAKHPYFGALSFHQWAQFIGAHDD